METRFSKFAENGLNMANHGPVYGLSKEIQIRNQARFNFDEAKQILLWIERCNGRQMRPAVVDCKDQVDIGNTLKDGVQLCLLAEKLLGFKIPFRPDPKLPFYMMENISLFLTAIKEFGVPEISCFQTVDLYERKQFYKVFECLRSLASLALKKKAPVPIPHFAVKLADENPRHFPEEILNQSNAIISLQYGTNKAASQRGMTPYGLHRQILPDSK